MTDLTPKQEAFCQAYIETGNASEAYRRSYNAAKMKAETIHVKASQMLAEDKITVRILELQERMLKRHDVTIDYVLSSIVETMERCKQATPVFNAKGEHVLTETAGGDQAPAYVFNAAGVLKGAELLGKHLVLFTDKVAVKDDRAAPALPELSEDEAVNMLTDRIMEAFNGRQAERDKAAAATQLIAPQPQRTTLRPAT